VAPLLPAGLAASEPPPAFRSFETAVRAYPTRAQVDVGVQTPGKQTTHVDAEYAPAEPGGGPPPEGSPAWIHSGGGAFSGDPFEAEALGTTDPGAEFPGGTGSLGNSQVRHLLPGTSYFARFVAENSGGRAVETVGFKTPGLAAPEVYPLFRVATGPPLPVGRLFEIHVESATSARALVKVESNGSETSYSVEYAPPEAGHEPPAGSALWKPFTSNASGAITPAEEYAFFTAHVTGLSPESTYYVRVRAKNAHGGVFQTKWSGGGITEGEQELSTFTTFTGKPGLSPPPVRNVTAASAVAKTLVSTHGSATLWRLEYASSASGPWTVVPGSAGSVSQAQAEAMGYGGGASTAARLTGLTASTTYFVRAVAENTCAEGCGTVTGPVASFRTSGAPSASTFMVHTLDGEALRVLGTVDPNSEPTSAEQLVSLKEASGGAFTLSFTGKTTGPIAFDAPASAVESALRRLEGSPSVTVEGVLGGPYTVWFSGQNVQGVQPALEVNGSGLTAPGSGSVSVAQQGGEGYDARYRFRYVTQKGFEEHGWTGAQETAEVDVGSGTTAQLQAADLPGLAAGETYRYRLVAQSNAPGTGLVEGSEQTLVAPPAPPAGGVEACSNEAFRTGVSAHLPDCRAYEQVTPVDKEGAQEPFHYKGGIQDTALVGMDGEHVAVEASGVHWGSSGDSPYFFSRGAGGWSMVPGSPQPQTGVYINKPEAWSTDLSRFAFSAAYSTAPGQESPTIEYKLGPAGGPYTTVASVPRLEHGNAGWVAATGDLSKLVLATSDRTVAGGETTGTTSGEDLYEYTAEAGLRQLNVNGEGETLGRCGAKIITGSEGAASRNGLGAPHAISVDGSRVFFYASAPGRCASQGELRVGTGSNVSLYMRVNGTETVDIGSYTFEAADASGTTLLLRGPSGGLLGYDVETHTTAPEPAAEVTLAAELQALGVNVGRFRPLAGDPFHHPRYSLTDQKNMLADGQAYRYDAVEHLLVCMSCASSFNPAPRLPAFTLGWDGVLAPQGGEWEYAAGSADGRFAFFTTPAALVPQDIDGEIPIVGRNTGEEKEENFDLGGTTSLSSDVYEWRAAGVNGCAHAQGCLALITNGRGGFYNLLLGTANEGRDVFIYTLSKLLPQDGDTAGDVYDARIGGGFAPPPPAPTECEADACSTPPPAPLDSTPSSFTFSGAGNLLAPALSTSPPTIVGLMYL
jgi:hypothetical protein